MWFYPGTYSYSFYGSNNVAQLPEPFNKLSSIRILNAVGSDAWTDVQGSWEEFATISKTDTDPVRCSARTRTLYLNGHGGQEDSTGSIRVLPRA